MARAERKCPAPKEWIIDMHVRKMAQGNDKSQIAAFESTSILHKMLERIHL